MFWIRMWLVITGAVGKKLVFREASLDSLPPRVLLTGYVADEHLPGLYSGAVAAICPSMYEGFGLPALECKSSAKMVLGGRCGERRGHVNRR